MPIMLTVAECCLVLACKHVFMQWLLTTNSQHVDGGLVELDKDAVVDLPQPEELQNLAHLGSHLVDTADADDKGQLGLGRHVKAVKLHQSHVGSLSWRLGTSF
jgi:hypothetical protein